MANYGAADVKKLREDTDAPMMECKAALDEADGDFARAKEILREKGKAAAAKRADRATGAGVVAFASEGGYVSGVVFECETDFVALNPEFVAYAQQAAAVGLEEHPQAKFDEIATEATAKFRENSKVAKHVVLKGESVTYVHHDKTKGAVVTVEGEASDAVRKVAIQIVAFPPEVLTKEELPQEKLEAELKIETERAIQEGKPENIAKNIAQGRINKEFIKRVVLLEQPFYADASKSVTQFLAEEAKGSTITGFAYLAVGA
jgi:elongation factor Ts